MSIRPFPSVLALASVILLIGIAGCAAHRPARAVADAPARGSQADQAAEHPQPRTTGSFIDPNDEPTAFDAARALTMRTAQTFPDCDYNGIPDSLDIVAGRTEDRNHNYVDDYCDDDVAVRKQEFSYAWRQLANQPDTIFFKLRHMSDDSVWVRYTVPESVAHVTLRVLTPSGKEVRRIVDTAQRRGPYEEVWGQDDSRGHALPDSVLYDLVLSVNKRTAVRQAIWKHRRGAPPEPPQR
jgi:hypothetical protein